uniref:DUF674 domain-containing protein n=1 Tax=Fagus sylvatica TaxID=28930 RepID=A0A2N9HCW7_FAGSY
MAAAVTKVSLKLMIHTESRRVVYAEASKEFVDFLFYILSLPVATFIPLLNEEMVGSLGNIYDSIANLSTTYLRPNVKKDSLLKPIAYFPAGTGVPLQLPNVESPRKLYRCSSGNCTYVYDDSTAICSCSGSGSVTSFGSGAPSAFGSGTSFGSVSGRSNSMSCESQYLGPPSANIPYSSVGDYVKGKVIYMVMDDLAVKPLSTISITTQLHKFEVKEIGALEEKVVELGMDEVVKLLKASLLSKTILTDVFLPVLKEEVMNNIC